MTEKSKNVYVTQKKMISQLKQAIIFYDQIKKNPQLFSQKYIECGLKYVLKNISNFGTSYIL